MMRASFSTIGTLVFLVAVAVGAACSDGDPGTDAGITSDGGADSPRDIAVETSSDEHLEDLTVVANPSNALSFYIEWRTSEPATTSLSVDCGDDFQRQFGSDQLNTEHSVFLMGLFDGASCRAEAESTFADSSTGHGTASFEVGPLPDFLPDLEVTARDDDALQPGWTLFNLNNALDQVPLIIAMVDKQGRYRWYHRRATSASGAATSVERVPQGLLVGGTHDRGRIWPAIINWEGELVWEAELEMHHDIIAYDADTFLWLGHSRDCPNDIPTSDTVHSFDWTTGEQNWDWKFCEHYTPDNPRSDWDHVNAIEPFPDQNALLLSARDEHGLFKVDLETDEVVWKMGVNGDFARSDGIDEPMFLRQHAPEIQPNGNIVLFDNGRTSDRPYSQAVELAYDTDDMTYRQVWAYRPSPDIFAPIWGDADRLENGNTLVSFGRRSESHGSSLIEATPDSEKAWELESPNKWGWYRADRLVDPPTGYVIEQ
jgi:hypothetical protein